MVVALVDRDLRTALNNSVVRFDSSVDVEKLIQPASIDIPLGEKGYLVKKKVLPFARKMPVEDISIKEVDISNGDILLKGQTYLFPVGTIGNLPEHYVLSLSPKSSIGRIDLLVRTVIDGCGLYDRYPGMYNNKNSARMYLEVTPQSFNVRVKSGQTLTQMMVLDNNSDLGSVNCDLERLLFDSKGNVISKPHHFEGDKIFLGLSVPKSGLVGYKARETNEVIDLEKIKGLDSELFFEKIMGDGTSELTFEKDRFYILATKEAVAVPVNLSAEMIPSSHNTGEFRAHYAGFFDPGWGIIDGRNVGAIGVLEVRPHEVIAVSHGQFVCSMRYFRNNGVPDKPYGYAGNNYHGQTGPKLAKFFRS